MNRNDIFFLMFHHNFMVISDFLFLFKVNLRQCLKQRQIVCVSFFRLFQILQNQIQVGRINKISSHGHSDRRVDHSVRRTTRDKQQILKSNRFSFNKKHQSKRKKTSRIQIKHQRISSFEQIFNNRKRWIKLVRPSWRKKAPFESI